MITSPKSKGRNRKRRRKGRFSRARTRREFATRGTEEGSPVETEHQVSREDASEVSNQQEIEVKEHEREGKDEVRGAGGQPSFKESLKAWGPPPGKVSLGLTALRSYGC